MFIGAERLWLLSPIPYRERPRDAVAAATALAVATAIPTAAEPAAWSDARSNTKSDAGPATSSTTTTAAGGVRYYCPNPSLVHGGHCERDFAGALSGGRRQ